MNRLTSQIIIKSSRSEERSLILKNPVIAASGTFGFGREYAEYMDLKTLGGIAVKGLTPEHREGNPVPRIVETPSGMLNSIGLQNPGIEGFIQKEMPFLREQETAVIANISGNTIEDYENMALRLDSVAGLHAIEVNVSCPNIHRGGEVFGTSGEMVRQITQVVREATSLPVIVKLSPNVTDIASIARQAESAGADAVSLINTILGMAVDIKTRRPVIKNIFGGLSGPAVKPVALRQVWQVYEAVRIPIIGMGGIMNANDAIEFLLAGATAVSVGTANFVDPTACIKIINGIAQYQSINGFSHVSELTGLGHREMKS
jgi:dihydroorotate dehydrogenase (NAD+) catalytic subunit